MVVLLIFYLEFSHVQHHYYTKNDDMLYCQNIASLPLVCKGS